MRRNGGLRRPHRVFTVGYEGRNFEEFVRLLRENGVTTVIDTRFNGFSYKQDFRRWVLEKALPRRRIKFLALPMLGSPKPLREELKRTQNYRKFFKEYKEHIAATEGLSSLKPQINGEPVAIMCFERDVERCHRSVLVEKLAQQMDLSVTHL